jgi:hypothetical protein
MDGVSGASAKWVFIWGLGVGIFGMIGVYLGITLYVA